MPLKPSTIRILLLVTIHLAAAPKSSSQKPDEPGENLNAGHQALKKGLHHKAYEHYKLVHRAYKREAYDHTELQEGLCVCAAKLKKESVAITACENATALRAGDAARRGAAPPPPPLHLLMAMGEAKLFASEPAAAREHFREAERSAAARDALRHEKEARDAIKRAEGKLFTSFSRQRGACTSKGLLKKRFGSLAEALEECAASPACKAVGVPLVSFVRYPSVPSASTSQR